MFLGQPVLFPFIKIEGHLLVSEGIEFSFFIYFPPVTVCVTQLFTHSPRAWTHWRPTNQDLDTSCCVGLCVAYVLHIPWILQKEIHSEPDPGVFCTFVVAVHGAGVITSLWEFFTHFFGLILQSLLKPICFAHLIGNSAFIVIAAQFKRGLRQLMPWSERA